MRRVTVKARGWLRRAAALALLTQLFGCAQTPGVMRFHYLPLEQAAEHLQVWPPPPDVPRYRYVGELQGEANFVEEGAAAKAEGTWNWLIGSDGEEGRQPRVLQRPQSGVVDEANQRVLVTDVSRQAVFVFDQLRGELAVWENAQPFDKFKTPIGIAITDKGEFLVADADLALVARLDANGNPLGVIGQGALQRPTGIAFDLEKKVIYVADTTAHNVKVFDEHGGLLRIIGRRGEGGGGGGIGEFNYPTFLHFSQASGELYVTDSMNSRVQVFDREGRVVGKFGERGLYIGNLVRPKGVTVDSEGHVYVVESYFDHMLVYDKMGRLLLALGGTGTAPGNFYLPAGVWTDQENKIYVADMFNGRVVVFQFLGGS